MNWKSALDKKKPRKTPKEIMSRRNFGVMKWRKPDEGRDRKW